jgi:hypothetical protein
MAKRPDYTQFLLTAKSAYFFQKQKSLSKALVERMFHSAMRNATGNALQRVIRKIARIGGTTVRYSFILFREESEPGFLDGTGLRNIEHCFLLVCELPSTIAVIKSHAHFTDSDLEDAASVFGHAELSRLYMRATVAYERIGMRMMNLSRDGIHSSTLEAPDLARAMSTLGTNRAIPTGLRIKSGDDTHTVTPSTGRIGQRDARSPLRALLTWTLAVEQEIARPKPNAGFIDHFAAPMKLSALPAGVVPAGAIFTLSALADGLADGTYRRLLRQDGNGQFHEVTGDELPKVFETARQVFEVEQNAGRHWLFRTPNRRKGELKLNTNRMTVAGRLLKRFYAERPNNDRIALGTIINQGQDFLVCFSDPRYAYFGGLFFDGNLLNQIDGVMSVFIPVPELALVTSEKGALAANSNQFPANSVFGVIHQTIALNDDILVCDDIDDEWADEIGIRTSPTDSTISFYVAKHKAVGLSASDFQEVIGQAQKNLAHLNPIPAELQAKLNRWGQKYNAHKVGPTLIDRVLKGASAAAAVAGMETVLARPITQRRMCLVISFISVAQLTTALNLLKNTGTGPPQLIQLLWFVTAFVSSCRSVGAIPWIYCCP